MSRPKDVYRLDEALRTKAREMGFSMIGVADPRPSDHSDFLQDWIESLHHGEMGYLAREDALERRGDLRGTLAGVRSAIVVADEYYLEDPEGIDGDRGRAIIARYARGRDYHDVLKAKLTALLDWLSAEVRAGTGTEGGAETGGEGVRGRCYVDTGPVLERELGQRAGLGWFGRNCMLIHPARGSYFFLGVLLVDLDLPRDAPIVEDRCGSCRACLDACPTGALQGRNEDGAPVIDARRCISYLTIELRGSIPEDLRPAMGNRVFGCDICQEVCPWNDRFATPTTEPLYRPRADLDGPALVDLTERLLGMSEKGYQREFTGSPLARPRRKGMLRNLCVALGNWGDVAAVPVLRRAMEDPQPLVREHAEWALARIGLSDRT